MLYIYCGESITINAENIVSEDKFYKEIEKYAKEACDE